MRRFKLYLALLASGLMAYSPVTIAAINTQQKTQMNSLIKEFQKSSFREIYNKYGINLDQQSRGYMEEWLNIYGPKKIESIQVQPIKGANNKETYRIIMTYGKSTLTISIDPDDSNAIDINGAKFSAWELQSVETVMKRLAKTDAKLSPLAKQLGGNTPPKAYKSAVPNFAKMTLDQKAQYFMMMKLVQESAEKVQNAMSASQATLDQDSAGQYSFHPLFQSILAMAADYVGKNCGVAGWAHEYEVTQRKNEKTSKMEAWQGCPAFPVKNAEKYKQVAEYSKLCNRSGKYSKTGTLVACNPLLFGAEIVNEGGSTRAVPYCQSIEQADFTQTATQKCNEMAGIPNKLAPNSKESIEKYRKILESLALLKGKAIPDVKECFGNDNRIESSQKCRDIFQPIFAEHQKFFASVQKDCTPPELKQKTADQKNFCEEFMKRSLAMNYFTLSEPLIPAVDVSTEIEQSTCAIAGGDYNDPGQGHPTCICPQGHIAERAGTEGAELHTFKKCLAPVVDKSFKSRQEKEEKCKSDSLSESFNCHPFMWIGGGLLAAWMISRFFDTNSGTPIASGKPTCGFGTPFPCNYWPNEGNNGKTAPPINGGGTGGSGGVRGGGTDNPGK